MSRSGKYIERRDKHDNYYTRLQEDSIALLQRLCGELWTDFNTHDPGVTILDLLNNALDELRYKLDFPLPDYLVNPSTGKIPFGLMGLLPFDDLLRPSMVTPEDYERLMTDTFPQIASCRAAFANGYYDFTLHVYGAVDRRDLLHRAVRLYHANRNIGETLGDIKIEDSDTPAEPAPSAPKPSIIPTHHDIVAHRSVMLDFPDCYGINRYGPASDATAEDKARILQLKSYLSIFDNLLSTACSQAANAAERLSGEAWHKTLNMLYGEQDSGELAEICSMPELNRRRFCSFDIFDPRSIPTANHWDSSFIIEHLLLYPDSGAPDSEFCRVSLLRPAWEPGEPQLDRFPAHITPEVRGIKYCDWHRFEHLYRGWREAMAAGDKEKTEQAADGLKKFVP